MKVPRNWFKKALFGALCLLTSACGSVPRTHHYALTPPARAPIPQVTHRPCTVLAVEELETDEPYADERIVYRPDSYRLEYYHYHQWSALPGVAVSRYLRDALAATQHFQLVSRAILASTHYVLGGRVVAMEEVDVSEQHWVANVELELMLRDARTGATVWARHYGEREPLAKRHPSGLARALSTALSRIVTRALPEIRSFDACAGPATDGRAHSTVDGDDSSVSTSGAHAVE